MGVSLRNIGYRFGGWPRRLIALGCLVLAAFAALGDHRSGATAGPAVSVVVATHDLGAGATLTRTDVISASWPAALRPASALSAISAAVGRRLAGPVRAREPITSTRLIGAELTSGLAPGLVATTITVADSVMNLVHSGDTVDLFLGPAAGTTDSAHLLAASVQILAVLAPSSADGSSSIVVAVDRIAAIAIAGAADRPILATVRGSP
jgi:pilus assembly protein CpaB